MRLAQLPGSLVAAKDGAWVSPPLAGAAGDGIGGRKRVMMRLMPKETKRRLTAGAVLAPLLLASCAAAAPDRTATPIEHVIVVVGENLSFDHLFATFRPPAGETVANLLSKGIVAPDGSPGPNVALAMQLHWARGC